MYYVIDKPALLESIKEEVSHVADAAYAEDGTSLYDSVMVTMRDKRKLQGFIDDAVSQFVRREFDITKYDPEVHYYTDELGNETTQVAYVTPRLILHVPDFDSSMEETAKAELDRYIVMYACAAIFQQRRALAAPEYTARAKQAMDNAVAILKYRKHPVTRW